MGYAKEHEVTAGTRLIADGGFTCLDEGAVLLVQADDAGDLFVPCAEGAHMLDGQLNEGSEYLGLSLA